MCLYPTYVLIKKCIKICLILLFILIESSHNMKMSLLNLQYKSHISRQRLSVLRLIDDPGVYPKYFYLYCSKIVESRLLLMLEILKVHQQKPAPLSSVFPIIVFRLIQSLLIIILYEVKHMAIQFLNYIFIWYW